MVVSQSPKAGVFLIENSVCQVVLDVIDSEMWQ